MKKWGSLAAAALIVASLAGCTTGVTQSFDSVGKLKDAYMAAGGVCDGTWKQDNVISKAAQSGVCGDDVVLSVYDSATDRDAVLKQAKAFGLDDTTWLVGPNWIVNSPSVKKVAPKLGGEVTKIG